MTLTTPISAGTKLGSTVDGSSEHAQWISLQESKVVQAVRQMGALYTLRDQRFIATTGYVTAALNTPTLLALFRNPASSGKWIFLDSAEFGATVDTRFNRFGGGTATVTGTKKPVGSSSGGSSASAIGELYIGGSSGAAFSIPTPGTERKVASMRAFSTYQTLDLSGKAVLRPGQQIYWQTFEAVGGGSGSYEAFIDLEWIEIPDADVTALQAMANSISAGNA